MLVCTLASLLQHVELRKVVETVFIMKCETESEVVSQSIMQCVID